MMTAPLSSSYPYLSLYNQYRDLGTSLTYGEILCFADALKKRFIDLNYWEKRATSILQHSPIAKQIVQIMDHEEKRREQSLANDRGFTLRGQPA